MQSHIQKSNENKGAVIPSPLLEKYQSRLKELEKAKQDIIARYNQIIGHIAEIQFWIGEENKK